MKKADSMDKIVTKLSEYMDFIRLCQQKDYPALSKGNDKILFRGHGNKEWKCLPKLFRNKKWFNNEKNIIDEVLRRAPEAFNDLSPFEILVKMQHYGVPTRLLDFTGNPMVALYFACSDKTQIDKDGTVLVAKTPMFFESRLPVISILDRLFPNVESIFANLNRQAINMINAESLCMGIIPKLSNPRIKNQEGYFVLYTYAGDYKEVFNPLEENGSIVERIVIPSQNKNEILEELNFLGINEALIFPELEIQIKYIVERYSR